MHPLEQHLSDKLANLLPHSKSGKLLLAISGGLDSVVLAHALKNLGVNFGMAHMNFGLRGAESQRDENFVKELASTLDQPIEIKRVDTAAYAEAERMGTQAAARALRYAWFAELIASEKYLAVATAHHANDNVETVLMHLFRGSGIRGLRGIQPVQGQTIRPLLSISREALEAYARQYDMAWVEDSSNATDKYTRNLIRHQVVDALLPVFPKALENFNHSVAHLREVEQLCNEAIVGHLKKILVVSGAETHIGIARLKMLRSKSTVLYEALCPFGFLPSQLPQALHLLDAENGATVESATHRLIKNRAWLVVAPAAAQEAAHISITSPDKAINFSGGKLTLSVQNDAAQYPNDPSIAYLDAAVVTFPLLLRRAKPGDYFYPLGMKKKKKVARFLIDAKLGKTEKERVWVVESQQRIVWVVGLRIDERCKILPSTAQSLVIKFTALVDSSIG